MWQWAKNQYHLLVSFIFNLFYGFPGNQLTVIGVTGTSGKTTTAHMIYEVLKAAGLKVSLLTSIKAVVGDKEYDTGFHTTTPDPHVLPKFLRQAVENGSTHFVLEVSSHALDQNRAAFIPFKVGVLTSLAHEHLDYHKTFFNYAKAKFKLLHHSKYAVFPQTVLEDKKIASLIKSVHNKTTFGLTNGLETQTKWKFRLKLPGDYNILNALAAASAASLLEIPQTVITSSLEGFSGIPGRFEEIESKSFRVVIDFAHKPDALEEVLKTARAQLNNTGRIICLYGCASERDVLKRPMMGEISGRLADITILTDEDPRFEDPLKIINEIARGCEKGGAKEQTVILNEVKNLSSMQRLTEKMQKNKKQKQVQRSFANAQDDNKKKNVYFKIPNREEAIRFAIQKLAKKGDIVLFCGKGHEKSMNYQGKELPWNEHAAVAKAMRNIK